MRTLGALVFPGFQTLDFFGPMEMLGDAGDKIEIITVAQSKDPVPSVHGQKVVVDKTLSEKNDYDLLFIPGGDSAFIEAENTDFMQWIKDAAMNAEMVMAVCTGTVILGMTGVLDGRSATTNKLDFIATTPLAPKVNWVKQARWVQDGKFFTSSGVSAGMDMALAAVAHLFGTEHAERTALTSEYTWHKDPKHDPFAKSAGFI